MREGLNRLLPLEGLRGLAAVVVVLFHALVMFYPAAIHGLDPLYASQQNSRFEDNLFGNPLGVFFSGTFAVGIFFVLSGFVLSVGYFKNHDQMIVKKLAMKRYIRLMVPALVSVLLAWVILAAGFNDIKDSVAEITGTMWLANIWQFYPSLLSALSEGAWGVFFVGSPGYNLVLWTMFYEFIGSFIVFATLLLAGTLKRRWAVYTLLIMATFNTWFLGFVIGMILADMYARGKFPFTKGSKTLWVYGLIGGLFLGGYPSSTAEGSIYQFITIPALTHAQNQIIYLTLGATLLLITSLVLPSMARFFSLKPMAVLGKYTFSMYLVHIPVLLTVGASVFLLIYPSAGFHWAAVAAVTASLPVVALVSYWFEKYVDAPAIRASGMFANWMLELPQKPGTEFELPKESSWLKLKRFVAGEFNKIVR